MDITVKQLLEAKTQLEKDITNYINNRKLEFETVTGLKVQVISVSKSTYSKFPDYRVTTLVDIYNQPKESGSE